MRQMWATAAPANQSQEIATSFVAMETLVLIHSEFRWLVLVVLIGATALAFVRYRKKAEWSPAAAGPFAKTMIVYDIQVLLGLILVFANGLPEGRPDHPFIMLAALVVGHIAIAKARKTEGDRGYFVAGRGLAIVLLLTFLAIPW